MSLGKDIKIGSMLKAGLSVDLKIGSMLKAGLSVTGSEVTFGVTEVGKMDVWPATSARLCPIWCKASR